MLSVRHAPLEMAQRTSPITGKDAPLWLRALHLWSVPSRWRRRQTPCRRLLGSMLRSSAADTAASAHSGPHRLCGRWSCPCRSSWQHVQTIWQRQRGHAGGCAATGIAANAATVRGALCCRHRRRRRRSSRRRSSRSCCSCSRRHGETIKQSQPGRTRCGAGAAAAQVAAQTLARCRGAIGDGGQRAIPR